MSKNKMINELDSQTYVKLKQEIFNDEYENVISEAWLEFENSVIKNTFTILSNEGKMVYALSHAEQFAYERLNTTKEEFYEFFGDQYDYILKKEYVSLGDYLLEREEEKHKYE